MAQEEILPLFHMEFEMVGVRSQTMHDLLVEQQEAFNEKFPHASEEETEAFQTAINTATALPLDGQVVDMNKVLTAGVVAQVKLGQQRLSSLRRYAVEAWPADEITQRVFGQDNWAKAWNDTEKMRDALEHAYNMANEEPFRSRLVDAGFKQPQIDGLLITSRDITTAQKLQKMGQARRPMRTQDRILAFNLVWTFMQRFNNRAQEVWANDYARRKAYNLYPSTTTETDTVGITVYRAGTTEALSGATVRITNSMLLAEHTNSEGKAKFTATEFPDLLDIRIEHETEGFGVYEGLGFEEDGVNEFVLEVPHGTVELN